MVSARAPHVSMQWLDELLPPNAAELCRGRVTVVVTTLPSLRQVGAAPNHRTELLLMLHSLPHGKSCG